LIAMNSGILMLMLTQHKLAYLICNTYLSIGPLQVVISIRCTDNRIYLNIGKIKEKANLEIGRVLEEVVDHALGTDPLPVEDIVEGFRVRDVNRDQGKVLK
jgi:hypothetical protein